MSNFHEQQKKDQKHKNIEYNYKETHSYDYTTARLLTQSETQWLVNLNLNCLCSASCSGSDLKPCSHIDQSTAAAVRHEDIRATPFAILK
jgi:hypothetical protein